ncbi:hypothetical protein FB45DRAFT_230814 [Roridomyces roridus]|uniref:MYND-type domain-containing protein n=1 Tax=Roridomyces roridus TaxID=1738132 RepID=A0AAD7BCE8_9AGAR|nr:hypothetical protein FB45DRAFT_230814 [Roridomyces roridus]
MRKLKFTNDAVFCYDESCTKTKLKGDNMSLFGRCKCAYYCSVTCQRADWPRHKPRCNKLVAQAALDGPISGEFWRWRKELGVELYQDIAAHALRGHPDADSIESKIILLTLRLRDTPGTSTDLQVFQFQSLEVLELSDLGALTGEPAEDLVQAMREWAGKMKLCVEKPSGAAWVITEIRSPDGSQRLLLNHHPVALAIRAATAHIPPAEATEDILAMIINQGMSVKFDLTQLPKNKERLKHLMQNPELFDMYLTTLAALSKDCDIPQGLAALERGEELGSEFFAAVGLNRRASDAGFPGDAAKGAPVD